MLDLAYFLTVIGTPFVAAYGVWVVMERNTLKDFLVKKGL